MGFMGRVLVRTSSSVVTVSVLGAPFLETGVDRPPSSITRQKIERGGSFPQPSKSQLKRRSVLG